MISLFVCLVHESPQSVVDLVRNLSCLAPDTTILLYNGGSDPDLLEHRFAAADGQDPLVHPVPRQQCWGQLHGFALDCMRYGLDDIGFDTLTIVDSDQLLLRPGYSAYIERFLATRPNVGMLGCAPGTQPRTSRHPAVASAWRERELWMPLCRRLPGGATAFPQWTFWPTTVFTAQACRDLVRTFDSDPELRRIMEATRIFATEEIVLPTLVALHGYEIARNPCSHELVQYDARFTTRQLRAAMDRPDIFWAHPIPRQYDHPLRRVVRERYGGYGARAPTTQGDVMTERPPAAPLLRTLPILERMRPIEGWLSDEEADLLIAAAARALAEVPPEAAVVEIGSYCGRSTTVLGSVVKVLRPAGRVYAIDPHDGEVGGLDQDVVRTPPTLAVFRSNIAHAGLDGIVETLQQRSWEVRWETPVGFLLVDGLHDYANVSRDFGHFERWLVDGGYVAFHDYAEYWPGVRRFVDELLDSGRYERVDLAGSMVLLRRRGDEPALPANAEPHDPQQLGAVQLARIDVRERRLPPAPERKPAPEPAIAAVPLVSCVMPTYDRRPLVPGAIAGFLRQDYANTELLVVDDGPDPVADLLPDDPRVRHIRLDRRRSIGAKRNLGCEAARGDLLANWDDDDWYASWRLSREVTALQDRNADVVGLNRLLYLEPRAGRAWRYVWPPHARPWVHDAVLMFTRELWQRNPFPDTSRGIDCRFLWTREPKRINAIPDESLYVGLIHDANTSPKNTRHGLWSPYPLDAIEALMGDDAPLYLRPVPVLGAT